MALSPEAELRELFSLRNALKSEMRVIHLYMDNPGRWQQEVDREEKLLADRQAKVDRLYAYRDKAWDLLNQYAERIEQINKRTLEVKNADAIARLQRLQAQINEMRAEGTKLDSEAPATQLAACDADDDEPCDGAYAGDVDPFDVDNVIGGTEGDDASA